MRRAVFLLGLLLVGCPSTPLPDTGSDCLDPEMVGETCYTCASSPACVWCASAEPAERGCRPRAEPGACEGARVRISDRCNALTPPLDRQPSGD